MQPTNGTNSNRKAQWRQHKICVRMPDDSIHEVNRTSFVQDKLATIHAEMLVALLRMDSLAAHDAPASRWAHEMYADLEEDGIDPFTCTVGVWRHNPTITVIDPTTGDEVEVGNPDAFHGYELLLEIPVDPSAPRPPTQVRLAGCAA
jgi:hypothetical protein